MPVVSEKQYVKLTSRKHELQQLLGQCGEATVLRIGHLVEGQAKAHVPQPPARSKRGGKRTGSLKRSIHLEVSRRGGAITAAISTGPGRNGFRYGALVEGIVKPSGRSYTSTPFERPAFDAVLPQTRAVLVEETRRRESRLR